MFLIYKTNLTYFFNQVLLTKNRILYMYIYVKLSYKNYDALRTFTNLF